MVRLIQKKLATIFGRGKLNSSLEGKTTSSTEPSHSIPQDPIWKLVALPREQYDALYLGTIRLLSEDHDATSINKAITYSVRLLKIRRGIILPPNAIPEDIRKQDHQWTYATFVSALHKSLGIAWDNGKYAPKIASGWLSTSATTAIDNITKGKASDLDGVYSKLGDRSLNHRSSHKVSGICPDRSDETQLSMIDTSDHAVNATPVSSNAYHEFREIAVAHMDTLVSSGSRYNNYGSSVSHSSEFLLLESSLCESISGDDFSVISCVLKDDQSVGYGDWSINESYVIKGIGVPDNRDLPTGVKPVSIRKCMSLTNLCSVAALELPGLEGVEKLRAAVSVLIGSPLLPPINSKDSQIHQKGDELYLDYSFIKQLSKAIEIDLKFGEGDVPHDARQDTFSCICKTQGKGDQIRTFHAIGMRGLENQVLLSNYGDASMSCVIEIERYDQGSDLDLSLIDYIDETYSEERSRKRTLRYAAIVQSTENTIVTSKYVLEFAKRKLKIDVKSSSIVMNMIAETSRSGTTYLSDLPFPEGEWKNGGLLIKQRPPICWKYLDAKQLN